jgi:K+-transporting ATPase ATPase C chain
VKEEFTNMRHVIVALRLMAVTVAVCCIGYTAVIWGVANAITPWTAKGSLLTNEAEEVVGSALIAQAFSEPKYFWPRPSAVNYDASATGGSNLSPANPALVDRLQPFLEAYTAGPDHPLPADLATASGSGMDPHITFEAARFQAPRVAQARGISDEVLLKWLADHAESPGGVLGSGSIVNVLKSNRALDNGEVH